MIAKIDELTWYFQHSEGEMGLHAASLSSGSGSAKQEFSLDDRMLEVASKQRRIMAKLASLGAQTSNVLCFVHCLRMPAWRQLIAVYGDLGPVMLVLCDLDDCLSKCVSDLADKTGARVRLRKGALETLAKHALEAYRVA